LCNTICTMFKYYIG